MWVVKFETNDAHSELNTAHGATRGSAVLHHVTLCNVVVVAGAFAVAVHGESAAVAAAAALVTAALAAAGQGRSALHCTHTEAAGAFPR